jgi:lipopolysaccharide transport system permease protein
MQYQANVLFPLIRREIAGRYRGSALGTLWSLVTPLLMLAIYTFVFGTIFKMRWTTPEAPAAGHSMAEFAIILFAGLVVFQLFNEVVTRSPGLVLANVNYVKKIIFPLEILPLVAVGSALFHMGISILVLFAFMLVFMGGIPLTAALFPLVLAPFVILILGLAWFLASLGVYLRDIGQILGTLVTALMFLSPIFFPASALPEQIQRWILLNPIALPVEQAREVLVFGHLPDFAGLAVYTLVALVIAGLGYTWFQQTRKGFADVL